MGNYNVQTFFMQIVSESYFLIVRQFFTILGHNSITLYNKNIFQYHDHES